MLVPMLVQVQARVPVPMWRVPVPMWARVPVQYQLSLIVEESVSQERYLVKGLTICRLLCRLFSDGNRRLLLGCGDGSGT